MKNNLGQKIQTAVSIQRQALKRFSTINGTHWSASFAFDAFFSLFPILILSVSVASFFIDRDMAGKEVIGYLKNYIPISGEMKRNIFETIDGVILARKQAGVIALLILTWSALQCFSALINAVTLAWGTTLYNWWKLVLASLKFLGFAVGAILAGIGVPVFIRMIMELMFPSSIIQSWIYEQTLSYFPLLIMYGSLCLFYTMAPSRRVPMSGVWATALFVTILLTAAKILFVVYLNNFSELNAVYGAFGGIMALLLWIYLSGCFVIYGACLCAVQCEMKGTILSKKGTGNDKK